MERCPADFYAFAKTWQPKFESSEYDAWLETYYARCFDSMIHYSVAILIPPGCFDHVDDGVRAKADTQHNTHVYLDEFISRWWCHANFTKPKIYFHRLQSCDIIDRVKEVDKVLTGAKEYFKPLIEKMSNL